MAENRARRAPRNGAALLGGLLRCGRCGRRMQVHYSGSKSRPWYGCTRGASTYAEPVCQSTSAAVLDELVAGQILEAAAPAALEASLAAVAGVEREREALARQWQLRRERPRCIACLAGRPGTPPQEVRWRVQAVLEGLPGQVMHNNPVERGYVDHPLHWRYSSAKNYAGRAGLIGVIGL